MSELVQYTGSSALAVRCQLTPEQAAADYEKRIQEANELEAKLKRINEEVPTRVYNVSGSTAGAGSGDFHQYRMVRRAEQMRLARIEEDYQKTKDREEYEAKQQQRAQEAEERTARKRSKRQRKKEKKKRAKVADPEGGAAPGEQGKGSDGSSSDEETAPPPQAALD